MKKKKLLKSLIITVAVIALLLIVMPYVILAIVKQPKIDESHKYSKYFVHSYEESRENIQKRVEELEGKGVKVEYSSYAVDAEDDLYIDYMYLPSEDKKENLIVLTAGVHGMEGYIGSTMVNVFFEEIYPNLDLTNTGIIVVENINPYGMKYYRRYNENNVDLNRNFILDWETFDLSSNKDYPVVKDFLEPKGKTGNAFLKDISFFGKLAYNALTVGADKISDALLTGQYEYPEGVYYGGVEDQASTTYLKQVFANTFEMEYENIIHVDLHSGYGPRYDMVIFNSVYDTMTEAETKEQFKYDYIIAFDSESFYPTTGDTTDFYYRLAESKNTDKQLFSTCFEFGTLGDEFIDTIFSLKYTIEENRNHWYPTTNKMTQKIITECYNEMYYPTETEWRENTVDDFMAAMKGVLNNKLIGGYSE